MNSHSVSDSPNPAASRIESFDLARGLAILFMILVHILDFYGENAVREGLFGHVVAFLGAPPAAPVFMFIMGIFIFLSSRLSLRQGLQRAALLLLLGYLLNLGRGSIPMWLSLQLGSVTPDQLGPHTPLTELLIVDILQFAGLAFAACVILKHYLPQPGYWLAAGTLVLFVSPALWDIGSGQPLVDEVFKLLWGHSEQGAMFPLFPWLSYPLFGMAFGYWLKRSDSQAKLFRQSLVIGLTLLTVGTLLTLSNVDYHYAYYLRGGPGLIIWVSGFVLLWLWLCHFLVDRIQPNLGFKLLFFWSRNVTAIYVIQWLIIGWGLMLVGVQQLSMPATLFAMLLVCLLSDLSLRLWLKLQPHLSRRTTPPAFNQS